MFQRFKSLLAECSESVEKDDQDKRDKFKDHGIEIWGLGYQSSDDE